MGPSEGAVAHATYRYLRLMLITLPALLLVSTALALFWLGIIETSISAYYLGPIRDLFVGVMMAIAACLVAYRGSSALEDFSLDVAGFFAIFVALVPTDVGLTLAALEPAQRAETVASLQASSVAVLVVSALFVLVELRTAPWTPAPLAPHRRTRTIAMLMNVALGAFVLLVVWRVVEGADFDWIHGAAAVLFVGSLAVAVGSHGWPEGAGAGATEVAHRDHRGRYRLIFVLMIAGAPLFALLHLAGWRYTVLAIEWYEVAVFMVFWILETRRTWSDGPLTDATRRR